MLYLFPATVQAAATANGKKQKTKKNCAHKTGKSSILINALEHINMHKTASNDCG